MIPALLVLAACADNPVQPAKSLLPHKLVRNEVTSELFYNSDNQAIKLETTSVYNGGTMVSTQYFTYDFSGKLIQLNTTSGWQFNYHYLNGRIASTEELVNAVLSQIHEFEYDNQGQLVQSITYQDIPEEGGVIPVARDTYAYDRNGNLTRSQRYYYSTGGTQSFLLTTHDFSQYDNKINPEPHFYFSPINPLARFFRNNPGRLEVRNGNGILSSTETYLYSYNSSGYAVTRTTRSIGSGIDETYQTTYSFIE